MPQCSAPKCKNKGAHVFPRDPTRRKQWENALPIKNFTASKWARLCSRHFKADDYFGKSIYTDNEPLAKFLKKTAVPSIFSVPETKPITLGPLGKKGERRVVTCVLNCKNTGALVDPLDIGEGNECEQPQPLQDDQDDRETSHRCKECGLDILGFRYTCVECPQWDICNSCEVRAAHALHYVLRVPRCKPPEEVKALVAAIRNRLINNEESQQDTELCLSVVLKEETEEDEGLNTFDPSDTFLNSSGVLSQDVTSEDNYASPCKQLRLKQPSPNKNTTKTLPHISRPAKKSNKKPLDRQQFKRTSHSTSTNMEDQTVPNIVPKRTRKLPPATSEHEIIIKVNAQTIGDKIDDKLPETQAKDIETAPEHNLGKPLTETRTVLPTPTNPVKLLGSTITLKKISPTDDVKLKIHSKGIRIHNLTKSTHLDKLKLPLAKSETGKVLADTSKASPNHPKRRLLIPICKRKILQVIPYCHSNRTTSKPLTTPVSNSQTQR